MYQLLEMALPQTQNNELVDKALEKIRFGDCLMKSTEQYCNLEGIQKLQKKINQEVKFLRKIVKANNVKKEHLQCSNLTHFAALVDILKDVENCQSVNKVFMLDSRKITIDIVCDCGLTWMKVIARNPKSLNQICMGDTGYGVRSVIDQAEEYIQCGKLHPCLFQTPKIVFAFANGITENIALKLESMGVVVHGNRITAEYDHSEQDSDVGDEDNCSLEVKQEIIDLSTKNASHITKVNVDVSAMLAYCSNVTNGSALLYDFNVPVLKQQAAWERLRPIKPLLDNFFEGKKLYCCETAKESFMNIVEIVGGSSEKVRAEQLLERIKVLPDNATASDTIDTGDIFNNVQFNPEKCLPLGGKIKERSLRIFTFGDRIQAVTVTSNDGFVKAAKQQGINFVVFVHESRALTEQKEQMRAVPLKLKEKCH